MASKVPFEIWLRIAHYLPSMELQRLYALNCVFYRIAMDARYREVVLFERQLGMAETLRKFDHLSQSHIACRVRYIKICLSEPCQGFDPLLEFENLSTATRKVLASLSRITKCDLVWPDHYVSRTIMPSLWSVMGLSNLQSLKLACPLKNIHSLLQPTSVHFPTLENVHLQFYHYPIPPPPDMELFMTSIVHFLNRHRSSLVSLTFSLTRLIDDEPVVELSYHFGMLGYFPRLRHLGILFGCLSDTHIQMSEPEVFAQFLKNHADQLQSFSIQLVTLDDSVVDLCPFVEYGDVSHSLLKDPFLNVLKLDISSLEVTRDPKFGALNIIPWFSDTLTTLILQPAFSFTYEQVEILASYFRHRSKDTGLKSLSFRVNIMSPEIIDLLASSFPGLVRLTLGADALKPKKPKPPSGTWLTFFISSGDLEKFQVEMEKRVYDEWGLCHLDIDTSRNAGFSSVMEIIEKRIPNIQRMREGL